MGKGCRFFQTFAVGLVLACAVAVGLVLAVLPSQLAYAQILSCPSVTLQEGTSGDSTCQFVNNTSGDITIASSGPFAAAGQGSVAPDSTDFATSSGISGSGSSPCTAGETLSASHSCGLAVGFTTENSLGETDNDVGTQAWRVTVNETNGGSVETFISVDVKDPLRSAVPEPDSVLLLGTSLLGAFGLFFLRRKLR